MNNPIKCQQLFTFNSVFFENLFKDFLYPWEILPQLKGIITALIKSNIDGYESIGDDVLIGKDVRVAPGAYILGPAIIGRGSEIRHGAFIRGAVILGEGCIVGNSSEIKSSIMMDEAAAPHFNYVGDSILGEHAHLGAGAICSNLRSDGKSVRIHSKDGEIDTKMRKLGAILGDRAEIGCGSVLCPGTIIGKRTAVYPLTVTRGTYPADSIVKDTYTVVDKL